MPLLGTHVAAQTKTLGIILNFSLNLITSNRSMEFSTHLLKCIQTPTPYRPHHPDPGPHRPAAGLTAVPRTGPHSPCVFPHRNTVLLPSPGFSPPPNRASSSLEVGPVDETFIHFFTRTWDSCGALPLSHRGAPLAESRPAFCAAGSDHL